VTIMSKPPNTNWDANYDRIFGKLERPICPFCKQLIGESKSVVCWSNTLCHQRCYNNERLRRL
jgi:hypothetical protein